MKAKIGLALVCVMGLVAYIGLAFAQTAPKGTPPAGMVSVPAGDFWMGCNEKLDKLCGIYLFEKPYHKVNLDAFYIDKLPVTQAEFNKCIAAGKCSTNSKTPGFDGNSQPVVGVTWSDAKTYCEWAGKRLPTEAEWEKAARGTDGRVYPWGNSIDPTKANYSDTKVGKTSNVGSYAAGASPYGALDMAGNVMEWVSDWFDKGYYSNSPAKNPKGPDTGKYRILRGGSWGVGGDLLRTSARTNLAPGAQNPLSGFRCVKD